MGIAVAGSGPALISASSFVTTAGTFRSSYATCGAKGPCTIEIPDGAEIADGQEYWLHLASYTYFHNLSTQNEPLNLIRAANSGGGTSFTLAGAGQGGLGDNYILGAWNTSGGYQASGTSADLSINYSPRFITFDVNVKTDNGTVYVKSYVDGGYHNGTSLAGTHRGIKYIYTDRLTHYATNAIISEVVVSTEDTRGIGVKTLLMSGNGVYSEWLGDYTDIDEDAGSDGLTVKSTDIDQRISFTKSAIASGTATSAVIISVLGSAASGLDMVGGLRIGGVDYYGTPMGASAGMVPRRTQFDLSPATGVAFTSEEINGMEVILKAIESP